MPAGATGNSVISSASLAVIGRVLGTSSGLTASHQVSAGLLPRATALVFTTSGWLVSSRISNCATSTPEMGM